MIQLYEMSARDRELLIRARTQLLAIVGPDQGLKLATEFAKEVNELIAEIERLLGY